MDISTQLQSRKGEKGFTLVELAVVMIIIGLLIGGVFERAGIDYECPLNNNSVSNGIFRCGF